LLVITRWVWQSLGATRFMHNPELWGVLQFESGPPGTAELCRNVEWPVRHALTQVYRAEREMFKLVGRYTQDLRELQNPMYCNMVNHSSSCNLADLGLAIGEYGAAFNLTVAVDASAKCSVLIHPEQGVRYAGGACFVATSHYRQPDTGYEIVGRIDASRFTTMEHAEAPSGVVGRANTCLL
jgi:hypothetical protein